jgi:ATP-binding cassette subfamily B protein
MQGVSVQASGHTILTDINLSLKAGEHLAIVGPSGAGKTSLVSILLGWHKPVSGQCLVEGQPLEGQRLRQLRRVTAWVDPAVQLWNRSLFENLMYGNEIGNAAAGFLIEEADLFEVVQRLENGMQTVLGESGGLVSGGEGQRVRLGRAINRPGVRLIILDEPFRGLDRAQRRVLLQKARQFWRDVTLICVTHDVGETQAFERVLVMESGRIVEDGAPPDLAARPDSRYQAMLEAEQAVRVGLWEAADWRRLWIEGGRLSEKGEA